MRAIADNPFLLVVLLLIIVVIFGANKLPDAARSLGRSMRVFKSEVEAMNDDPKPATGKELRAEPAVTERVVGDGATDGAHPVGRATDDPTR